jgi:hypothetical protein
MGCFTSFARTSVALVALSLLVLQASGEEGMYLMFVCIYVLDGYLPSFFFAESFFNSFLWLSSGFGSLCSECDVTDLLSQRWMEEEIGSFRKFVSLFPRFFL